MNVFFFSDIHQGQRIHCYTIPDREQSCWVFSSYGWLWMSHNYLPESPTQYQISTCHSEFTLPINYHWLLHLLSVPLSPQNYSLYFPIYYMLWKHSFPFYKIDMFSKIIKEMFYFHKIYLIEWSSKNNELSHWYEPTAHRLWTTKCY